MGLIHPYMVKRITASGGGSLQADPGESFKILDIFCTPSTNDTYLTLRIDKVTVGYIRVKGFAGNHCAYPDKTKPNLSLLGLLREKGIFEGFPVPEGSQFTVSRYAAAGDVMIVYEIYDGPDMKPDMANGKEAKEYLFFNYVTNGSAIAEDGDSLIDKVLAPAEFPDFPVGKDVPAKNEIDLIAVVGSPVGYSGGTGANTGETSRLKLVREREVLFDEDMDGQVFEGKDLGSDATDYEPQVTQIGAYTDTRQEPAFFFPKVLTFVAGEELGVYVTIKGTAGTGIPADTIDLCLVEKVRKVA